MKNKLVALFALLAIALTSLSVAATPARADEPQTIKVDVAAANGDYDGYTVDDDVITLLEADTLYELSGETSRQVLANNANAEDDQFFYLLLNDVTVQGGIAAQDLDNFRLAIRVFDDTTNNVETIDALNLWILGDGILRAESINARATSTNATAAKNSYLAVEDTQVEVQRSASAKGPCTWMGTAELSGTARVTYVSAGDYASLVVLNVAGFDEAVTIMDSARLECLHANVGEPSSTYVDGLHLQGGKLLLQDGAFLQAEARPLADAPEGEGGCAVFSGGDIEVRGSAQIQANASGPAILTGTNMSVSGEHAYVRATSKNAQGIYLEGGLSLSDGGRIDATGKLEAVYTLDSIAVDDATLTAESELTGALSSSNDIGLNGAIVAVTSAPGFAAFSAASGTTINGSLIVVEKGDELGGTAENSVVFMGAQGTVYGDATLLDDLAVDTGETLTVPAGASLTIPAGNHLSIAEDATLVNNGTIHVLGAIDNEGAIVCNSHCGGVATCSSRAVCDVCHAEYGELDPASHMGLVHVEAKAATTEAEGNIEYWVCNGCSKYFADAAAREEIVPASTVLAKLPEQKPADNKPNGGNGNGDGNGSDKKPQQAANKKGAKAQLPATGDATNAALPLVAAIAGVIVLAGGAIVSKRN